MKNPTPTELFRLSRTKFQTRCQSGSLAVELMVAVVIFTIAVFPLAYSFVQEGRMMRHAYFRSIAMELVDGEMEALVAGEWRAYQPGEQTYPLKAESARNLPPGKAKLTITGKHLKLSWTADKKPFDANITRETDLK